MRPEASASIEVASSDFFWLDDRCGSGGKNQDENLDARSGTAIRRGGDPTSVMLWGHEVRGLAAAAQCRRSLHGPPRSFIGVGVVGCRS
jgi:hypothetical protein